MARGRKRRKDHPYVFCWDYCTLRVTVRADGQVVPELTGLLPQVSGPDRERVAAILAGWLRCSHEEAYKWCWSKVRQLEGVLT